MGEPVLELLDVRKSFGNLVAVDGISLDVAESSILGLAGPNGAGKSTLFNVITHVPFGPDSGRIRLAGRPLEHLPAHRICKLGLTRTFQSEAMFSSLNVRDNVRLAALHGSKRISRSEVASAVSDAIAFVALEGMESARETELSVLDRKRLMIATALVSNPKILLLDEPVAGLNEEEQHEIARVITKLRDRGLTLVVVEHVLPLLRAIADQLVILTEGKILTSGKPADVLRDPRVIQAYTGAG
jgi:branched-chain amino acid transport system ATP-binding protein